MGGIPLKRLQEDHNFITYEAGISQDSGLIIESGEYLPQRVPLKTTHPLDDGDSQVNDQQPPIVSALYSKQTEDAESDSNSNLIINYLPLDLDESALKALFSQYGRISHVKVVRDRITKRSLGYGFVKYLTKKEAADAIQNMNGYFIRQKKIKVSYARPSSEDIRDSKIFVQNLPIKWDDRDVQNFFSQVRNIFIVW